MWSKTFKAGTARLLKSGGWLLTLGFWLGVTPKSQAALLPVARTNTTPLRLMAANLTGASQTYGNPELRIFQGLKPDIVAIQEFNFSNNTPADFRTMVDLAFGANFVYYRESQSGYSIPNGIISRYPIRRSGTWDDVEIPDRGFAWAQIDIPGEVDLFLVSVHLKASSGDAARRANQAANLKGLIQANVPTNCYVAVAGDFNIGSAQEAALATFYTFLTDNPIPTDQANDPDTNLNRNERYDYILPDPNLNTNRTPTVIGANSFAKGLVFDSRVYSPLAAVAPVQTSDSATAQHMAVVKDFLLVYWETNLVEVPNPKLSAARPNAISWVGIPNLNYTVWVSTNLPDWQAKAQVYSTSSNYIFTNPPSPFPASFLKVTLP